MFQHIKKNKPVNDECGDEENDIIEIKSDYGDDEEEDEIDEQDDTVNKTFINPTQVDNTVNDVMIKCDTCEFQANCKSDINKHKHTIHNWCKFCFSSFIIKERLNNHIKKKHDKFWKTD